jgi:hypothetical protein
MHTWEEYIKTEVKETGCGLDWVDSGYGSVAGFLQALINFQIPQKQGIC